MNTLNAIDYTIFFGEKHFKNLLNWVESQNYSKIVVLCDSNTRKYCSPILPVSYTICEISAGEINKNLASLNQIWRFLMENNLDRNSLLINLGGGMITDIGGFSAATYMRGIDFIQIPTSLLGMVDASVGGKTGIDFYGSKNLIGSFALPKGVWIYPKFLDSLDPRQYAAGKAEMIKHGLIADEEHFAALESINSKLDLAKIKRSVEIKNTVVLQDTKEQGLRKILNFGHTVGHALESYFLNTNTPLLHGEAIFLGMYYETLLSKKLGLLSVNETVQVTRCLKNHISTPIYEVLPNIKELIKWMRLDKKNNSNAIDFTLLTGIGKSKHSVKIKESELIPMLTAIRFKKA